MKKYIVVKLDKKLNRILLKDIVLEEDLKNNDKKYIKEGFLDEDEEIHYYYYNVKNEDNIVFFIESDKSLDFLEKLEYVLNNFDNGFFSDDVVLKYSVLEELTMIRNEINDDLENLINKIKEYLYKNADNKNEIKRLVVEMYKKYNWINEDINYYSSTGSHEIDHIIGNKLKNIIKNDEELEKIEKLNISSDISAIIYQNLNLKNDSCSVKKIDLDEINF